jgi:hypothetical protein
MRSLPRSSGSANPLPTFDSGFSQVMVLSTIQERGSTTKPWAIGTITEPNLRLHHFHRPNDRTSVESSASFGLARILFSPT